jgi:hypothetical protein
MHRIAAATFILAHVTVHAEAQSAGPAFGQSLWNHNGSILYFLADRHGSFAIRNRGQE